MPRWLFPSLLLIVALVGGLWWLSSSVPAPTPVPTMVQAPAPLTPATYVDEQGCQACHAEIVEQWRGSHHDLAMQHASAQTVLGDFADVEFFYAGERTRFFQRDDAFWVQTPGADGQPAEFRVDYTFGVEPLQQYLVALPGGRLQALPFAWDTAKQRWFHLYPDDAVTAGDVLHWTGPAQNWNFMCAECHSTQLEKRFDLAANSYDTRWFQIDVGCQACHGPASRHLESPATAPNAGFPVDLAGDSAMQIDTCARCHSRRSVIDEEYRHGDPLLDHYLPALLEEGLYFADGQILDEVYVYGSFRQSRMHQAGLRCSDCHNPHSAQTWAEGNALCVRCHNPTEAALPSHIDARGLQRKDYDSPEHHFHTPGEPGSFCVDCHAPQRTYMVVDPRRDHSFRIPRPDLHAQTGAPDACTGCHADQNPEWAAQTIREHHPQASARSHYGVALAAGREASAGAVRQLAALLENPREPAMVRATALQLLQRYPGQLSLQLGLRNLSDDDAQVRRAAVERVGMDVPQQMAAMLNDPVRAVRIEAARLLAAQLPANHPALQELEASYRINAERPEALAGWSLLNQMRGDITTSEQLLVRARQDHPQHVGVALNLAELYRQTGREAQAESLLRERFEAQPEQARLGEALALSLLRQQRHDDAQTLLTKLHAAFPRDARLSLLQGLMQQERGDLPAARKTFEAGLSHTPGDRQLLLALAALQQTQGDANAANATLGRLRAINPADPALQ